MSTTSRGRLVILTGPSCAGKSPLDRALGRFHPELRNCLEKLVLYNDRDPRPGERDGVDYHFRTREEIESLGSNARYVLIEVRGDLQALDLEELRATLDRGDAFFEGNPFVGAVLQTYPHLTDVERLSAFLSPLSRDELLYLRAPERHVVLPDLVTDVMRRKLLRRTRRQKGELSLRDLEDIERRAGSAYCELQEAWRFGCVIPCQDGEDSENWDAFYFPLGAARRAVEAFAALLAGEEPSGTEAWEEDLLP